MPQYAINDQGVQALKGLSTRLPEQIGIIDHAGISLVDCCQSNAGGLGPHASAMTSVVEEITQETKSTTAPVMELKENVDRLATKYQAIISNNRHGG